MRDMTHNWPPSAVDYIKGLEKRIETLERAPRSTGSTIEDGNLVIKNGSVQVLNSAGIIIAELGQSSTDGRRGLQVNDAGGALQMRVGELASAGYGMEQDDGSGNTVVYQTMAFGMDSDVISAAETRSSATYGNLATIGPTCSVSVGTTGRMLVMMSFYGVVVGGTSDNSWMGFTLTGPTALAASDQNAAVLAIAGGSTAIAGSPARIVRVVGLNAGTYTVQAKYRGNGTSTGSFAYRNLTVIPY